MIWTWATLMPHPPVLIPAIGKGREAEAQKTLNGLQQLVAKIRLLCQRPETTPQFLLLLSPHHPYAQGSLFINAAPTTTGNLARFGAPQVQINSTTPAHLLPALSEHLKHNNIPASFGKINDISSDHGALVPLYFLAECFPQKQLPPLILANPIGLTPQQSLALGAAFNNFFCQEKGALIASGDLSHKLTPQAPAGFNPAGALFDKAVVECLQTGDSERISTLPTELCQNAGECGMRSAITLLGVTKQPVEVLSYEGPYGVGYCTAFWQNPATATGKHAHTAPASYPALARRSIQIHLAGQDNTLPQLAGMCLSQTTLPWATSSACFVSIKTATGALRGCMGTILPTQPNLALEIISNAIMAAERDPRFPPIAIQELPTLSISVDVLSAPEPVTDMTSLDPKTWGVIVTKNNRRGLLLPDLDGVDTVEQQLSIACQKAGISDWNGATIQRFSIERFKE